MAIEELFTYHTSSVLYLLQQLLLAFGYMLVRHLHCEILLLSPFVIGVYLIMVKIFLAW